MCCACSRSSPTSSGPPDVDIDTVIEKIAAAVNEASLTGNTLGITALDGMPDMPEPPCFYPFNWRTAYHKTHGGMVELTMTWHLALSRGGDDGIATGQKEAQRLSGSGESTILAALTAARGAPGQYALDGAADDVVLTGANGPIQLVFGDGAHFWGVEFTIFVMG